MMNSSEGSYNSTFAMCVYYLAIGIAAILANFLNLAMYMHSKEARRTYMCFIAFEFGELINSVSFLLTGAGRLQTLYNDKMYQPITVHECFYERYWPHALILGTEIPTLFLILTSLERICAVCFPALFNGIFSERRKVGMIAVCLALAAGSIGAAAGSAYKNYATSDSGHCAIIHSTAKWYSTFHFAFIILGYGVSLLSLIVMKIYSMKLRDIGRQAARRDTKTNILVAFTATSLLLVASPSIVMIGLKWEWFTMDDIWVALAYSATVMVSIANMIINFVFREDFRQTLFRCTNSVGITHHKDEVFSHIHHTTSSHNSHNH